MTEPGQGLFDLPEKAPAPRRTSTKNASRKNGAQKTGTGSAGTQKTARKTKNSASTRRRTVKELDPKVGEVIETYASEDRLENAPLKNYLGASTAKALARHLGLETVGQALEYYPRKYLPRGELTPFSSLVEGSEATIVARVLKVTTRQMASRRGSITEITITDQLTDQPPSPAIESLRPNPNAYRGAGAPAAYQPGYSNPRLQGSAGAMAGSPRSDYGAGHGFKLGAVFNSYAPGSYAMVGNSDTMTLSFFNAWTAAREIHEGDQVMFSGKVGTYRGELTLTNPHYAVIADRASGMAPGASAEAIERAKARANAPIPVYKATPKYPTDRVAAALEALLERLSLKELEDPVPFTVRKSRKIPSLAWTYRAVHTPDTEQTWRAAHHSLRYREAFVLQAALARIRAARAAHHTLARPFVPGGLADALTGLLPYKLTEGQETVGAEIRDDLASSSPMNRLLQGDVGSGKTVVALRAMLQVADNGAQAAMLAPTEVLAEQHYRSVCQILGDLLDTRPFDPAAAKSVHEPPADKGTVRVVLLTASLKTKAKKEALLAITSGSADIVIGTHALLADAVQFADLGLVVVDEQHRFGVEQRDALRGPGGALPHRLVMTATPIPRTVAMTVFGDLDTSVLDQLPAGRQKISTHVVPLAEHPTWAQRIWSRAREEIDAGHQVYVVVPKIGGGDSSAETETGETLFGSATASTESARGGALASVESVLEDLEGEPALAGVRIAGLHGRMDTAEKNRVMTEFSDGQLDLLVSTTVIEVGVNVPNATLMVIMDADRFGISGLHQLRGRIGRGQLPGTCLLVTKQPADGVSRERLDAVASTTDGFELSRVDLEQRREGDILGAAQSGKKSTLKLLRALTDAKLIERARQDAFAVIERDPTLALHPDLARTIDRALDADREAFLGRG
ncbi:ATP-dependent DNA helicase RecG [Rothia sp. P5766]|uniref:ATP-dependent DNA helicase RecG n=1 Tax=unclassified Rothia (in: high G+C Gram-positive bacteria) TaxID=2689056 RepID=UPI003AE73F2E